MKPVIVIIITLVCSGKILSQNDSKYDPAIKQMSLQHFIETCFQENYKSSLYNIGQSGICYARFQITPDGGLNDIRVSPGVNETLAEFIKTSLEKTNGYWNNTDSAGSDAGEFIILPIEYNLQVNGKSVKSIAEPRALLSFFSPNNGSKPVKLVFLSRVEYTAPFDNNHHSKQYSIIKQDL